jgi:hypothetical protein
MISQFYTSVFKADIEMPISSINVFQGIAEVTFSLFMMSSFSSTDNNLCVM